MVWPLVASAAISVGSQLLSQKLAGKQQNRGAQAAMQAGQTFIPEELRGFLEESGRVGNQQLGLFSQLQGQGITPRLPTFQTGAIEGDEVNRLQELRRPSIERARAQLQSQLLNRGRLGVAQGGGRTGALFNPQAAALEEAILQAQLGDIGVARDFAHRRQREAIGDNRFDRAFDIAEQQRALANAQGLFGTAGALIERPNAGLANNFAAAGNANAASTRGFFSGLSSSLGGFFAGGARQAPALFPSGSLTGQTGLSGGLGGLGGSVV